jgi:urease accessory protein
VAIGMMVRTALLLAVLVPFPADVATAHPAFGGGGFIGGVLHPLFVPAHALAIVALGLLIAQQSPQWPWPASVAYCAGLAAGFVGIVSAMVPPPLDKALLASALVSSALIALARPIPQLLVSALSLLTGLALAFDSPPHAISLWEANIILIGTFCSAVVLLLAVIEGARALGRNWQRLGVRIIGSWIAATAIMALALRLAR